MASQLDPQSLRPLEQLVKTIENELMLCFWSEAHFPVPRIFVQ